jgi:Cu(I)/Ag(I) efflux system protein CusF
MLLLALLALLDGCSSPTDGTEATGPGPEAAAPVAVNGGTPSPRTTTGATATGVVESVDVQAQTVTIAHDPVAALQWPAMTMTFKAPGLDLSALKPGDHVSFGFTSRGMDGTITTIESR